MIWLNYADLRRWYPQRPNSSYRTQLYTIIVNYIKYTKLFFVQITSFILLHEKFLQFDWLRAVVFQLNLRYLHVKITKPLRVVVYSTNNSMIREIWHKYHSWYFNIVSNLTLLTAREISYNNFEISLVVFMPNIPTNHAITYTNCGGVCINLRGAVTDTRNRGASTVFKTARF